MLALSGLMDVTIWFIHNAGIADLESKTSFPFSVSRIIAESIIGKASFNFIGLFFNLNMIN